VADHEGTLTVGPGRECDRRYAIERLGAAERERVRAALVHERVEHLSGRAPTTGRRECVRTLVDPVDTGALESRAGHTESIAPL
jgi:hypothetical protein